MKTLFKAFFGGTVIYILGGILYIVLSDKDVEYLIKSKILIIGSVFFMVLIICLTLFRISCLNKDNLNDDVNKISGSNKEGVEYEKKV
ncbi:MAG: hypothetical protein BWY78_01464 [Alphaproteobacteria bacterium ADurb.Bin438]|nr:MAG: hypothetical protein BWY78_01464 [Alphaproteobacteria bacterium ADurb.Bin438]